MNIDCDNESSMIIFEKYGTICTLNLRADVMILGQDKIIRNVDCSRLKWIEPYMGKNLETNFTYESWLGEVLEISFEVIVCFADGARLNASGNTLNDFNYQISSMILISKMIYYNLIRYLIISNQYFQSLIY